MNTTTFNQEKTITEVMLHVQNVHCSLALDKEKLLKNIIDIQLEKDLLEIDIGARNGSPKTVHGMNAEKVGAAAFNSAELRKASANNTKASLMVKSPITNGPDDNIRDNGEIFQYKYYGSPQKSLVACIDHMEKYAGSYTNNPKSFYAIPKDQLKFLIDVKNGNAPKKMTDKAIKSIKELINRYEKMKGGSIEDTVKPGAVDYKDSKCDKIEEFTKRQKRQNNKEHKEENKKIEETFSPSVRKCIETGLISAGLGALTTAVFHVYNNFKQGKNIFTGEYTKEDYKKLALDAGKKGAIAGGMSTVFYALNAVFKEKASAVVLATQITTALAPTGLAFAKNEMSKSEFTGVSFSIVSSILFNSLGNVGVKKLIALIIESLALGVAASITSGVILGILFSLIISVSVNYLVNIIKESFIEFFDTLKYLFTPSLEKMFEEHKEMLAIIEKEYKEACEEVDRHYAVINSNINVMADLTLSTKERTDAVLEISNMEGYEEYKIEPDSLLGQLLG